MAFAHNMHLQYGKAEWQLGPNALAWWPAGAHLRQILGNRYAVVGVGVGTAEPIGVGQPEHGTLEALLTAAIGPGRFVQTQHGKQLPAEAISALSTRSTGKNPGYFPFSPQSFTDFDVLAVLDSIV